MRGEGAVSPWTGYHPHMRPRSAKPRRRPRLQTILVLPTLITAGNLLCGVVALTKLQQAAAVEGVAEQQALWVAAAWLIFVGMLCDALDGRIARLTHATSAFGAQLDSLADVVTFGVTPALLARTVLEATFPELHPRLLTALIVLYVLGAALRLARYNVESARVSDEAEGHVTMLFRGLPSPAAAGVVASLVLLHGEYHQELHGIDWTILLITPLLGLLMISRFPYPHVANRFLEGQRALVSVVFLVVTIFVAINFFHETIAVAFLFYASSGILLFAVARVTGRPAWVFKEDDDEASYPSDLEDAGDEGVPSELPGSNADPS